MMIFQPRFRVVGFYAAGWLFVIALHIAGVPLYFIAFVVLIQLVNTVSMTLIPVRVSIETGQIECHFPLRAATKRFDISEMACSIHLNPIRIGSFSDILVLCSRDSKSVIWRMGVRDFDRICHELRTAKAQC